MSPVSLNWPYTVAASVGPLHLAANPRLKKSAPIRRALVGDSLEKDSRHVNIQLLKS
jgi:hypothetical protein